MPGYNFDTGLDFAAGLEFAADFENITRKAPADIN